jgi:hypothetical protein
MKKHNIHKWCHRPLFSIPGLKKVKNNNIRKCFRFTDSCRYILDKGDQFDWNKLVGFILGIFGIHKNSFRFVWRYNPDIDKIEIAAYWYIDGVRNWKHICNLNFNENYIFDIKIMEGCVVFKVLEDGYIRIAYHEEPMWDMTEDNKYMCGIYFGGNRRAPHKITISEFDIH